MTDNLPEDGAISVPLLKVKSSWACTVSMSTAEESQVGACTGGGKETSTDVPTISGASGKAEAHGSRAGTTSPGVRAGLHLHISHVQEGVPEVYGTCSQHTPTDYDSSDCDCCCCEADALVSGVPKWSLQDAVQVLLTGRSMSSVCRVNAVSLMGLGAQRMPRGRKA